MFDGESHEEKFNHDVCIDDVTNIDGKIGSEGLPCREECTNISTKTHRKFKEHVFYPCKEKAEKA